MERAIDDEPPPPAYRRFVYLDADEVLNALSAVKEGAVEEAVDEIVTSGERNLGLSIGAGGQGLTAGGKSAKQLKRGVKRRQTVHAAMSALLHALRHQIRKLPEVTPRGLDENELVMFTTELRPCWSPLVVAAHKKDAEWRQSRGRLERLLDRRPVDPKVEGERAAGLGTAFVSLVEPSRETGSTTFILQLESTHLVGDPSEFSRRATVVAQVTIKPRDDEKVVIAGDRDGTRATLIGSTPESAVHQPGVRQLHEGELGWPELDSGIDRSLVLRPLCVYK